MGDAIREPSYDDQDPREVFLVEYQEETPLEIQDIQLEAGMPHVTITGLTLLLDGCCNPTWSQVGANWSRHIISGQLAPLGVLWLLHNIAFQWPCMASGHILP
ncbi:hypothetical protein O181_100675 [Austropuccinia psidii MF-1]|uniref:Uncharacterized protein n=1 Tax=Austropuccinia psidii MF-1 TaxID=1389203 RepID=A0A9Q3PH30_9BASI|nr:hypothetical protein [Austropuccinia psidii MF-1]